MRLRTEELCKAFLHTWQFRQQGRRRFLRLFDECRRVEVSLSVINGEHKGRFPIPHQNIAHDQSASAVIAFDVELWLAQNAHLHTSGTLPGGLALMPIIPAQDITDIAFFLLVEALGGGLNMGLIFLADLLAEAT
jgi:hypothetical protein